MNRPLTVARIQAAVAEHYGMNVRDLTGPSTERRIARPRQVAMSIARRLTGRSLPDIGARFGGRCHTTVLYACRTIDALIVTDEELLDDVNTLFDKLERHERQAA